MSSVLPVRSRAEVVHWLVCWDGERPGWQTMNLQAEYPRESLTLDGPRNQDVTGIDRRDRRNLELGYPRS